MVNNINTVTGLQRGEVSADNRLIDAHTGMNYSPGRLDGPEGV